MGVRLEATVAAAKGLCRDASGQPQCLCLGDESKCHARIIWGTMAAIAVRAVDAAGLLVADGVER